MKSEILVNKNIEKSRYPYLGKCENDTLVVLFFEKKSGTVIITGTKGHWMWGEYYREWDEQCFTPIPPEQKVVLSN